MRAHLLLLAGGLALLAVTIAVILWHALILALMLWVVWSACRPSSIKARL